MPEVQKQSPAADFNGGTRAAQARCASTSHHRAGVAFVAVLVCLALDGCSPASGAARFAAEMVQPGKSITWPDGRMIHVERRDGSNLQGIQFQQGSKRIDAAYGILALEPDSRCFRVTLFEASVSQDGKPAGTIHEFSVLCHR